MLVQYEGGIVDSIWETFLVSWHKAMNPPPPCLTDSVATKTPVSFAQESFKSLFNSEGHFRLPETSAVDHSLFPHIAGDPHFDDDIALQIKRMNAMLSPKTPDQAWPDVIADHLSRLKRVYNSSWSMLIILEYADLFCP